MVQPVSGLKRGIPPLVIHIRIANILQLVQAVCVVGAIMEIGENHPNMVEIVESKHRKVYIHTCTVYIPYSSIKGKEIKPTYVVGIITVVSYTHMYTYICPKSESKVSSFQGGSPVSHDMDVPNVEKAELHAGIGLVQLVPSTHCLGKREQSPAMCTYWFP